MSQFFFLNYSRTDAQNPYLKKFFKDLIPEVRSKLGLSSSVPDSEIGFMDAEGIKVGQAWPAELEEALQSCCALVSIYSPGYFQSDYCGREFQIFRSRLLAYDTANPPPLIFPVLWEMSPAVEKSIGMKVPYVQYTSGKLSSIPGYEKEGLCYLVRRNSPEYQDFLHYFAKMMAEEIEKHMDGPLMHKIPPLAGPLDIEKVKSAWADDTIPLPQAAAATAGEGPGEAQFFFFAGQAEQYKNIRKGLDCYNQQGGRFWFPYLPPRDKARQAQHISMLAAEGAKANYKDVAVDGELVSKIRAAEEKNTIVLLVVDPWSLKVKSYRQLLEECDERQFLNYGVVIAWNLNDKETEANVEKLREEMRKTFKRTLKVKNVYFRESVTSPEALESELCHAIIEIRSKLMQSAAGVNEAVGGEGGEPQRAVPIISGPASMTT